MAPPPRLRAPLAAALVVALFLAALLLLASDRDAPGAAGAPPAVRAATTQGPPRLAARLDPGPAPSTPAAEPEPTARDLPAPGAPLGAAGRAATDPGAGPRLARVRGRVVDRTGAPRAGVRVELHACQGRAPGAPAGEAPRPEVGEPLASALLRRRWNKVVVRAGAARTDTGGGFEVAVAAGPLDRVDLLLVAAEDDADGAMALAEPELEPDEAGLLDIGRLELLPAARIEVLARADGLPLQGATVRLHGSTLVDGRGSYVVVEARTGAAGEALLRHQGRELALHVEAPGRAGALRWLGRAAPLPPVVRVEVDLPPAAEVRGVVRDARGAPLEGVRVVARARDDALLGDEADTDAEGRFLLPGLATGQEYELAARDPAGAHVEARRTVVPPAGAVDLRLAEPGEVRVTLAAPEGFDLRALRALDGPTIVARRADPTAPGGWTAAEAVQLLRDDPIGERPRLALREDQALVVGLPPGTYRLHVSSCEAGVSGWSGEVTVGAGEEAAASVTLAQGQGCAGRLVDRAGAPLAGVAVEVEVELPGVGLRSSYQLATGPDGSFGLRRLPPEVVEVTVRRDGFEPRRVRLGEEGDLGDVALAPSPR